MQKVISTVRTALTDLQLAIEGTIIMNEALRDTLNSIYDAKVPETWRKVKSFPRSRNTVCVIISILVLQISWNSTTIGFWFTDLLDRNAQFRTWLFDGKPSQFWMTGFFNPQV